MDNDDFQLLSNTLWLYVEVSDDGLTLKDSGMNYVSSRTEMLYICKGQYTNIHCCSVVFFTFFVVRMFVRPASLWLLQLELCIADQHLIIVHFSTFFIPIYNGVYILVEVSF